MKQGVLGTEMKHKHYVLTQTKFIWHGKCDATISKWEGGAERIFGKQWMPMFSGCCVRIIIKGHVTLNAELQ